MQQLALDFGPSEPDESGSRATSIHLTDTTAHDGLGEKAGGLFLPRQTGDASSTNRPTIDEEANRGAVGQGVAVPAVPLSATDDCNGGPTSNDTCKITASPAWQHPQANRHIVLGSQALGYWLQRRRRRTVGMKIAKQGLEVHAPTWVNIAEVERILHSKSDWIVRKLQEQAELEQNQQMTRPYWNDGQYLPWRGGLLQVRLAGQGTSNARFSSARLQRLANTARLMPAVGDADNTRIKATQVLWLDLPRDSSEAWIRDCTAYWMQQQAYAVFMQRMQYYAPMLGVRWSSLKLSQADTRWGSASSSGVIRLHWRLMQMLPEILDYVVVHELAHLHEMNHGPRFWAWVERILPDYRQRQFQLKHTVLPPW